MRNRGLLALLVTLLAPTLVDAQSASRAGLRISVRVVRPPAPRTSMTETTQPTPMVAEASRTVAAPTTGEAAAGESLADDTGANGFDETPAPPPPVSRFRVLTINY